MAALSAEMSPNPCLPHSGHSPLLFSMRAAAARSVGTFPPAFIPTQAAFITCLDAASLLSSPSHFIRQHLVGQTNHRGSNTVMTAATRGPAPACDVDGDLMEDAIVDDYYAFLGVPHDATPEEIKKAYYSCMKTCHPDLAGEDNETTELCMFVNEVYEILSDPVQRMVYDEINGYSLTSVNPFLESVKPREHVFVDEFSCIGCKNCANTAPKTFDIEEEYGRARAMSQCGRTSAVQQAIDTCPVDCIHWVTAAQLSLLEDEMRRVERVNVGVMLSGMGRMSMDVFSTASRRWERKQSRAVEAAKVRMMKEKNKDFSGPWWQNMGSQRGDGTTDAREQVDPEVQERAARAAAAARKWREYSRKGVDRRPIYNLPANFNIEEERESESSSEAVAK